MGKRLNATKLTALILTLVIVATLLPLSLTAKAETPTVSPYYVVNWGGITDGSYEYMYAMPYTWISANDIKPETTQINPSIFDSTDVTVSAQNMKAYFDSRPEGTRYINLAFTRTVLLTTAKNQIDLTHGVGLAKDYLTRLFSEYARIGGKLDGVALDLEYSGGYYWTLHTIYNNGTGSNPNVYNEVVSSEVYTNKFRPMLVANGFPFYQGTDHPEIWYINPGADANYAYARTIWDDTWNALLLEYQMEGIVNPIMAYFPDAIISDYKVGDVYRWQRGMSGDGGTQGTGYKVGNTSNENAYNARPGMYFYGYSADTAFKEETGWDKLDKTIRDTYNKPASYNGAVYADSAYGNALWDVNAHKRMLESTDTGLLNSWIAFPNYGNQDGGYANTPFYSETILHIGLMTTGTFLGYVVPDEVTSSNFTGNPNMGDYDYNLSIMDDLMAELTRMAGSSDREPIITPVNWNDGYMLTGAYAGGRNIWRLTPDTSKVSVEDFMIKDKAPTFKVGSLTITFPQGRIIEDGDILELGTSGYWIETPENVMPVVTSDANRYSNDPSFLETFDSYATGTFNANAILPDTFWTVETNAILFGSVNANIVDSGNGNKALALGKTTTLTSTKIPSKITAGDEFAKEQIWEVTITLPSGSYGTVTVLKGGNRDGVQIKSGAVSYFTGSSSTATSLSGVSLSAGGTYTIRRKINFNTNQNSVYVYDANGNELGKAENKAMASLTLPISEVTFTTNSSTTNAVKLDNFKMYPTGVTTDFKLYDVANGLQLTDATARTKDTAYRLSWMNASAQYKKAEIYNASNNTVIKTIEMAPGMDGVVTDIVKANGTSLNLAVRTVDSTAPGSTDYDNGDFSWDSYADNLGITCIVGAQGYATLEEGIAAAKDGQKIVLMKDAVMSAPATVTKPISIQDNGFTITVANNFRGEYAIGVAEGGALIWNKDLDAGAKTALRVCGGELTVAGGTISGKNGIEVTGGTLNMIGGTVTASEKAIWLNHDANKLPAAVNVTGGALTGVHAFYHSSSIDTASANVSATLSGATINGAVETAGQHYEIKTEGGIYTLHGYVEATCTTPKRCLTCGTTEGSSLGHIWVDATCTTAKTCSACGRTNGEALGHRYDSSITLPTCTTGGCTTFVCSSCGDNYVGNATNPTGHIGGQVQIENEIAANCYNEGSYDEVTYCIVCGEEASRVTKTAPIVHAFTVSGTTSTCSLCGISETHARVGFHFRTSGVNTGWVDSANNVSNLVLNPGEVKYFTTAQSDSSNPNNYYLVAGANADNYNVKFEYLANGTVEMSLKNATISNSYGIFYGFSGAIQEAPLKVIVEADSSITTTGQMPALNLFSAGDVTITGPGKLDIVCDGKINTWGAITVMNNVILDEANISMNLVDGPNGTQGISGISSLNGGDIIIDDSQLTITGIATITGTASTYAFYGNTKGENVTDLTIRNGSKVQVAASVKDNWNVSPAEAQLICVPGTVTVSYSDFEIAGVGQGNLMAIFRTPTQLVIEGCTATWENNGNWPGYAKYDAATGTITPPAAAYLKDTIPTASDLNGKAYLKTVHVCVAGETTYTDLSETACAIQKLKVTSCSYCGEELSRETIILTNGTGHNYQQTLTVGQNGSATNAGVTNGYYLKQSVCSVCGETAGDTEQVPFAPAPFYYYTSGAAEANWIGAGTPTKVLNPGDVYYYTTTNSDVNNLDKYYMTATDDTENWNVKLEYPMGGTPTMTLKGATIKNGAGIWYGFHNVANQTSAPLNIIVASDSTIEVTGAPTVNSSVSGNTSGALTLCTTGDVTISGTGLLTLKSNASVGGINVKGNLNLNNANVAIYDIDQYEKGSLIQAVGNVTVSGGKLYGNAYTEASGWPTGRVKSLVAAANLTIQDGADVTLFGSAFESYSPGYSAFNVSGEIAISDSEVVFASNGGACDNLFNTAPVLGLTGSMYEAVASTGIASYNAQTGELIAPATESFNADNAGSYYYFKITGTTPEFKSSVVVGNDLTFKFGISSAEVDALNGSYAKITRNYADGKHATVDRQDLTGNTGFYEFAYPGLAAKEMGDSFTIAIYDDDGRIVSEVKQDSILTYALRLMRSEEYAEDTEENNMLKTLLVDMLNYGAEAQKQFGYNEGSLVNSFLTSDEQARASAQVPEAPANSAATTSGSGYYATSFVLNTDITMLVGVRNRYLDEGAYAVITFTDHYGNSIPEAERRVEVSPEYSISSISVFAFNGMAAADGYTDVTFEVFKSNGERVVSITDSLARYCARSPQLPIAPYIMKYSESAYAYLHRNDT